jgi:DNA-directed RNA polymerase I subunit RPA49
VRDIQPWTKQRKRPANILEAATPGLDIHKSLALKPYTKRRKNAPSRTTNTIAAKELLIESQDHPAIDYVGQEEEASGAEGLLKHYVGVFDPTTGELQVIESRKVTLRGIVRAQKAGPEAFQEKGDYKVCDPLSTLNPQG